jgi:uncharacterized protein Smg (DUF494 family)
MSEPRDDAVIRLLRMLAEHLEVFLEGNDLSFETLGEAIEQGGFTGDDLYAAIMVLRGVFPEAEEEGHVAIETEPGRSAERVWSAEERESVSPEAWGFLLDLRRRGSLDSGQFERVLDLLTASGIRPVGVDRAREVAARVVLRVDEREGDSGFEHAEIDLAN